MNFRILITINAITFYIMGKSQKDKLKIWKYWDWNNRLIIINYYYFNIISYSYNNTYIVVFRTRCWSNDYDISPNTRIFKPFRSYIIFYDGSRFAFVRLYYNADNVCTPMYPVARDSQTVFSQTSIVFEWPD